MCFGNWTGFLKTKNFPENNQNAYKTLILENGQRWQFIFKNGVLSPVSRFCNLLNLASAKQEKGIQFPFYPPQEKAPYTFFDLTRDTLARFQWLKNVDPHETISIVETEGRPLTELSLVRDMTLIAEAIALWNEMAGGLLVHGVMVESRGQAVIFAGGTGAGKTTAARKMPDETWKKHSDDRTLITKNRTGDYFAHPWPGAKAFPRYEIRYDAEASFPLKAVVMLEKDSANKVEKLQPIHATALLKGVVDQALALPDLSTHPEGVGKMLKTRFENLTAFVQRVPLYKLRFNLTDPFWESIEALLRK